MVASRGVLDAVRRHPEQAAAALDVIGRGASTALSLEGVAAAAAFLGASPPQLLLDCLEADHALEAFAGALCARDVDIGERAPRLPPAAADCGGFNVPDAVLAFVRRSHRKRCLILVNNRKAGSGWLVGPSLVLTAWHVVAPPAGPAAAHLSVRLSSRQVVDAVPAPVAASPCTDLESQNRFVETDAEDDFEAHDDFALIRLTRPAGVATGYDPLPELGERGTNPAHALLFHFPGGGDEGVGFVCLQPDPLLSARWSYRAATRPGSSGGACFDFSGRFLGLHNGRGETWQRLVPACRFMERIRGFIDADVAPRFLWQLDEEIVVGRDQFFEAVHAAARPRSRIRGIRVKRLSAEAQGAHGLAFSITLLRQVLERQPGAHQLVEVGFAALHDDLLADVAERAGLAPVAAGLGLKPGETSPQAVAKARAEALAEALEAREAAEGGGRLCWFFFHDPGRSLSADERRALEEFWGAAIRRPHLRVVVAGCELIATPGAELAGVAPEEEGEPGFVVEIFGGVEARDIAHVIELAAAQFGHPLAEGEVELRVADIMRVGGGVRAVNGRYGPQGVEAIKAAISADLWRLQPWSTRRPDGPEA